MGLRPNRNGGRRDTAVELELYRSFVQDLTRTCDAAAAGDLEARSQPAAAIAEMPELLALSTAVNRLLERCKVTVLACCSPHRVASRLEGVGQGAADAAGTTSDENAGLRHARDSLRREWGCSLAGLA